MSIPQVKVLTRIKCTGASYFHSLYTCTCTVLLDPRYWCGHQTPHYKIQAYTWRKHVDKNRYKSAKPTCKCTETFNMGVSNRWTRTLDWNIGLEHCTGLLHSQAPYFHTCTVRTYARMAVYLRKIATCLVVSGCSGARLEQARRQRKQRLKWQGTCKSLSVINASRITVILMRRYMYIWVCHVKVNKVWHVHVHVTPWWVHIV